MPRQARLDSPGTLHHVIVRGINKRRIVDDEEDRKDFVRRLGELAEETQTVIYAWALMSNHAHLLVCSGPAGIAKLMRRLLTGYAVSYNQRHRRYGICFRTGTSRWFATGIVILRSWCATYIHLNPLRVGLAKDLRELERYPYCGHGTILGRHANSWQNRDSVLAQFGRGEAQSMEMYRRYMADGVSLGRRPELVGGARRRGSGEWSSAGGPRRRGERESTDERILGSGEFVERILKETDARMMRQQGLKNIKRQAERVVVEGCKKLGVSVTELRSGGRRGVTAQVRAEIARRLVEDYGLTLAEVARQVGISTSGVSKLLSRSLSI